MDFAQTTAYDPVRKQLVRVPESQAEMLKEAGYSIGEQAHIRANADGWDGTAKAAAASFLNGATAGMSDYAMPASVAQAAKVAEEAHPIVSGLAKVGGIATGLAATGGLAPEFAIGARVLHGAAAGAMDEINRAKMAGEPIQWERVRSGLTIGGIFNAIAEGAPVAISALGKKSMKTLLNVWPKEASAEEAATFAKPFGEETAPVYKRILNEEHAHAAEIGGSLIGGAKGYAATKSIFAADRIITHSLNNLNRATDALDSISEGPMKAMEGTLKSLLKGGVEAAAPSAMKDVDKEYEKKAAVIEKITQNPEGFADAFSETLGPAFADHMPLHTGLLLNTLQSAQALGAILPKDPNDPTVGGAPFDPPHSMKKKFLEAYDTVDNFSEAMKRPTAMKIQLAEQTNPEQLSLLRNSLLGHIAKNGVKKLTPYQRRSISIILGTPLTPELSSGYLQRLQMGAEPPAPQPAPQKQGIGVKAQTAVTMRDMPDNIRLTTGI